MDGPPSSSLGPKNLIRTLPSKANPLQAVRLSAAEGRPRSSKERHGYATDRGLSHNSCSVPSKVISPRIRSRMKQADQIARVWINPSDVRALKPIAVIARHCQVFQNRGPTMLARNDVIDLERQAIMRMWDPAVFAAIVRASPDLLNQELAH